MAELKIYLSRDLNEKFRRIAMSIYGYGRGSISKAAEEALAKWCRGYEGSSGETGKPNTILPHATHTNRVETGVNPDERVDDSASLKNPSTNDGSASNDSS